MGDANFVGVGEIVPALVAVVDEADGLFGVVLTEEVHVLVLVAGGDQLPETEFFEIVRKVVEEVAHAGVVAIAVDDLALEMVLIVLQFPLDVGELGIELVLLRVSGVLKIPVFGFFRHSTSRFSLVTFDSTTYATRSKPPQGRKKSDG